VSGWKSPAASHASGASARVHFSTAAGGEPVTASRRPLSLVALAIIVLIAGWATVTITTTPAAAASDGSAPRWPAHPAWQRYVETPATASVHPVRITRTSGPVTDPAALTDPPGTRAATLTMRPGERPPTVVVDYGKDVGGVPFFDVRSESGAPVLHAAFSEGLSYLGPEGDMSPSASNAGDPSRADSLTVTAPGTFSTGLIQGGERYELITLTSPGSVALSSVGISFTALRVPPSSFRGWFDSSSPALNRIWFDGAYTTQLDELPAHAVSPPWRITAGTLEAQGGTIGTLSSGATWTDYTLSFDTRIVDTATDWMVRASSSSSGYLLILHTGAPGSPDTFSEIAVGPGEFVPLGRTVLPPSFSAYGWHQVTTVVSGTRISTSIDGRPVASFDTNSLPPGASVYASGTVGFAALGAEARFRDLSVLGPGSTTLFADRLSTSSALALFPGPNSESPDPLPVIVDGAKRDRVVWSGDLGVELPTVFYTTATDSFARGSLELLASYQVADGETGTNVDPTLALGTFPQTGSTYSASYSMDEVDNIATYYLYTGDLSFVRAEWPMITRELAYNASLVDSRGLLVTDAGDGQDWDYYDGSKIGEVTAYNDIYYRTLTSASFLADALGLPGSAKLFSLQAADLSAAMNRYLLDPSTGLYAVSNLEPTAVAQDANSLAVLFGIAPRAKDAQILASLARTLPSTAYGPLPFTADTGYRTAVSPFVTNEEVSALFSVGDTAAATSLLLTLWGHMDAPGPDFSGADWELVGANGAPGFGAETSLAHGWSSGATADLSAYVLGVRPTAAGFSTWTLSPHPGSLSWVEGDVPTPHGTIRVRLAQVHRPGRFALQVAAPARTTGAVSVPLPRSGALVSVRTLTATGAVRSTRTTATSPGLSSFTFTVSGGATDDVDVSPR
jgi:alpha-L-rhamnosidase